ncbi:MAG: ABC transporter permease [Acetobacteraceae bacterium]|nr:ABC transporter permease [Acetobacteraceae bacterium]
MSASQTHTSPAERPHGPVRLVVQSELTPGARQRLAWRDILESLRLWRLSLTLGWFDIRLRYRGSMLGPFWLTLSTAVMVAALGILYSRLFKMSLVEYLPFVAISLVLWGVLSTVINEACVCYTQAEGMIRSMRIPHTVHAVRVVVRNLLVLAHNVLVILAVYAYLDVWPGKAVLGAIPGLFVWMLDGLAACLLLGPVGARFRDVPPIVTSVVQIAFFISPVIWKPELLQGRAAELLWLNPFYTLLEILRGPLLGTLPDWRVWLSALVYSAVLWLLAWLMFARVRGRLAFWV